MFYELEQIISAKNPGHSPLQSTRIKFFSHRRFREVTYQYISEKISLRCSNNRTTKLIFVQRKVFQFAFCVFFVLLCFRRKLLVHQLSCTVLYPAYCCWKDYVYKLLSTITISSNSFTLSPQTLSSSLTLRDHSRKSHSSDNADNFTILLKCWNNFCLSDIVRECQTNSRRLSFQTALQFLISLLSQKFSINFHKSEKPGKVTDSYFRTRGN